MEDVILFIFFIFALIIALVISVVDSNVLVVESEGTEVWAVLCEADVDAIVLVLEEDERNLVVSEVSTEGVLDGWEGETVIDWEIGLDLVDLIDVGDPWVEVLSTVVNGWGIEIGFSGVLDGNHVEELVGGSVGVCFKDVDVIVRLSVVLLVKPTK